MKITKFIKLKENENLEKVFLEKKFLYPENFDIKLIYKNIKTKLKDFHFNTTHNPTIIALEEQLKEIDKILNSKNINYEKIKEIIDNDNYFIYLNNHGEEHVQHVISNASIIISKFKSDYLNSLEVFILLTAIQLHDSALAYGRDNHEIKVNNILEDSLNKYIEWN